jgi:hypothetical protein
VARIRFDFQKSARPFKWIICGDISEFESDHPSQAVRSPAGLVRLQEYVNLWAIHRWKFGCREIVVRCLEQRKSPREGQRPELSDGRSLAPQDRLFVLPRRPLRPEPLPPSAWKGSKARLKGSQHRYMDLGVATFPSESIVLDEAENQSFLSFKLRRMKRTSCPPSLMGSLLSPRGSQADILPPGKGLLLQLCSKSVQA